MILLAIEFMRFRRLHESRNKSFLAVEKFLHSGGLYIYIYMGGGLMRVKVIDLCKCYLRRLLSLGEGRRKIGFGLFFLEFKRDSPRDFLF